MGLEKPTENPLIPWVRLESPGCAGGSGEEGSEGQEQYLGFVLGRGPYIYTLNNECIHDNSSGPHFRSTSTRCFQRRSKRTCQLHEAVVVSFVALHESADDSSQHVWVIDCHPRFHVAISFVRTAKKGPKLSLAQSSARLPAGTSGSKEASTADLECNSAANTVIHGGREAAPSAKGAL